MGKEILGSTAEPLQILVLLLIVTFSVVLIMLPPITFLIKGWPIRIKQILNYFDYSTIAFYLGRYWQNSPDIKFKKKEINFGILANVQLSGDPKTVDRSKNELLIAIRVLCYMYFGRNLYIIPLFMLFVVTSVSCTFVVSSALFFSATKVANIKQVAPCILLNYASMSGIAGAYLWVVGDGIARMRINDYLPSDVYGHVIRLTIAIPLGLAISSQNDVLGSFLAFGVGTFPLETITRFIRASAAKLVGAQDDPDTDGDEIMRLTGINNDVAHRLMAEDIATVLALANCDPIRLMMRTNLDFKVVMDIMDQAILASEMALSDVNSSNKILDVLRQSGLSKASEIYGLMNQDPKNKSSYDNAEDLKNKLPALLGLDPAQVANILIGITSDDRTNLVCKLRSNLQNSPGSQSATSQSKLSASEKLPPE